MGIKEQALDKIKSLEKLDPDFVLSWLSGLIDLEQKIVSILYQESRALTIKDIMSIIERNTLSGYDERHHFPFKSYYPLPIKIRDKMSGEEVRKLFPDEKLKILKSEFKFPSFRRIDKTIQDLMNMGVVLQREEKSENKKIKGYYYFNPIIRTQLIKLKK